MSNNLYFIPIIAKALQDPDPRKALAKAFAEIQRRGHLPEYARGYAQFQRFMAEVFHWHNAFGPAVSDPAYTAPKQWEINLLLEKEGHLLARVTLSRAGDVCTVGNLLPGRYRIRFDTGRVLWEGDLTEDVLFWAQAFPGQPLELAADTGGPAGKPSLSIELLDGEILLNIFPGISAGSLQIQILPQG